MPELSSNPMRVKCSECTNTSSELAGESYLYFARLVHCLIHSSVFDDMIQSHLSQSTEANLPIDLDSPSHVILIFLDLMQNKRQSNPTSFNTYQQVLGLCQKFDWSVAERVALRLGSMVADAPWEILCIASDLDEVELARAAIKVMDVDRKYFDLNPAILTTAMAQRLSMPYLLGLIRAMWDTKGTGSYKKWEVTAEQFKPAK